MVEVCKGHSHTVLAAEEMTSRDTRHRRVLLLNGGREVVVVAVTAEEVVAAEAVVAAVEEDRWYRQSGRCSSTCSSEDEGVEDEDAERRTMGGKRISGRLFCEFGFSARLLRDAPFPAPLDW
jgi:hypothetical protein